MAKIDKIIQKFNKAKNALNTIKGITSKIEAIGYQSAIDELGDARKSAETLLKQRQANMEVGLRASKSALSHVKEVPEEVGNSLIYPKYDPLANYLTFDIRPRKDRGFSNSRGKLTQDTLSEPVMVEGPDGKKVPSGDFTPIDDSPFKRRTIALYIPDSLISQASVSYRAEGISPFARSIANVLSKIGSKDFFDTAGKEIGEGAREFINMTINRIGGDIPNLRQGIAKNPQQEQLLDSVPFRSWDFTFDFYPKDSAEALEVRNIIKVFRQSMLPDTFRPSGKGGTPDADNLAEENVGGQFLNATYYGYPNVFDIYFSGPMADKIDGFLPAVCTNAQVDYTGGQKFSTFYDGMPNHIQLTLNFLEIKTMTLANYEDVRAEMAQNGFGATSDLNDSIGDLQSRGVNLGNDEVSGYDTTQNPFGVGDNSI